MNHCFIYTHLCNNIYLTPDMYSIVTLKIKKKYFSDNIYIVPGHKHPKIILDGYSFIIKQKYENKTIWRCARYAKTHCKARFISSGKNIELMVGHNHQPENIKKQSVLIPQKANILRHGGTVVCSE